MKQTPIVIWSRFVQSRVLDVWLRPGFSLSDSAPGSMCPQCSPQSRGRVSGNTKGLLSFNSLFIFFYFMGKHDPQSCIHDNLNSRWYDEYFEGWYILGWNLWLALDGKRSYKDVEWAVWVKGALSVKGPRAIPSRGRGDGVPPPEW